ncbi:MAG: hypothetical protein L0322_28185 [Chloroflexi bacterium]|nr:hypothetical protein [Chloroflexota bacterium]MCI0581111.1 hypothetical protein [Chloroflexota bacterium]MCI0648711.1 hypothetical protein [Chloroflexota bacterium]
MVDVDKPDDPAVARITHRGSSNFAVWNHHVSGGEIDLLVNTIGAYDGLLPIDFLSSEHTGRFEVTADGSWTITVSPLSSIRSVSIPGSIDGRGDDVFRLIGGVPDTASIDGRSEGNFVVYAYGQSRDLLVNEIGEYSGQALLDSDTVVMSVLSEGPWTIAITSR